jgi:ankyrin repeat protein
MLGVLSLIGAIGWAQGSEDPGRGLIDAARKGDVEKVAAWIETGADLESRVPLPVEADGTPSPLPEAWNEEAGGTALIVASAAGRSEAVELLLRKGAAVGAQDERGWTALMRAAYFGHGRVASLLLEAGADPNVGEKYQGATALHFASRQDRHDVVRSLLEAGADPNAALSNGWTPLLWAVERGSVETVRLLLSAGANPDASSANGQTAYQWAQRRGSKEILALLEAAGKRERQSRK